MMAPKNAVNINAATTIRHGNFLAADLRSPVVAIVAWDDDTDGDSRIGRIGTATRGATMRPGPTARQSSTVDGALTSPAARVLGREFGLSRDAAHCRRKVCTPAMTRARNS
jgi:hypothetical protein